MPKEPVTAKVDKKVKTALGVAARRKGHTRSLYIADLLTAHVKALALEKKKKGACSQITPVNTSPEPDVDHSKLHARMGKRRRSI